MRGDLLNKARRGELVLRLPVGYRRRPDGTVVLDPDEAVRLAVAAVFERFAVLRNARAVQRHFCEHGLAMPRLIQHGPEAGRIVWVRPTYQMIQKMLTSPVYAGVFVYGRRQARGRRRATRRRRSSGGCRPEEWDIVVQDVYPAYLSYDAVPGEPAAAAGQPLQLRRQGPRCAARGRAPCCTGSWSAAAAGGRMSVSYGSGDRHAATSAGGRRPSMRRRVCQSFLGREISTEPSPRAFLEAVQPAGAGDHPGGAARRSSASARSLDRQWQLRLERARYEAQRWRNGSTMPSSRTTGWSPASWRRRWEAALAEVERLEQEYASVQRTELSPLSGDESRAGPPPRRRPSGALARRRPRPPVDRKRLLRLVDRRGDDHGRMPTSGRPTSACCGAAAPGPAIACRCPPPAGTCAANRGC